MKKHLIPTLTVLLSLMPSAIHAQNDSTATVPAVREPKKIFFSYDSDYSTILDNREYDRTDLDYSRTIFGAGIEGGVGLGLRTGKGTHRLMAGVSALFEFGGNITVRPLIWYQMNMPLRHSYFQILGGVFSRKKVKGFYPGMLYSGSNMVYDRFFEGFQFSWTGRNFYYELGIDWMGQLRSSSPDTREQFTIYASGRHTILPGHPLRIGYAGYIRHYACNYSGTAPNVVDNILFYPYIEDDFGRYARMQRILVRLGYVQALQRDRAVTDKFLTPGKGHVYLELRQWNVGIVNDFLFGGDIEPYFASTGPDGKVYGGSLYFGDPLMCRNADGRDFGLYDKVGIYWEPRLLDKLILRLQVNCHFNDAGFAGWQQIISLCFNFGN